MNSGKYKIHFVYLFSIDSYPLLYLSAFFLANNLSELSFLIGFFSFSSGLSKTAWRNINIINDSK